MAARTTSWWGGGCITEHFRGVSILLRAAGLREGSVNCPCRHAHSCGTPIIREGFYTAGPHTDGWPWMKLRLCPSCARNAESEIKPGHGAEMAILAEAQHPPAFDTWAYRRVSWEQDANVKAMFTGLKPEAYYQGPANEHRLDEISAKFEAAAKMNRMVNAMNTRTELEVMTAELRQRMTTPVLIQAGIA